MKDVCLGRIIPENVSEKVFDKAIKDLEAKNIKLPIIYEGTLVGYVNRMYRKTKTLYSDLAIFKNFKCLFGHKISSYSIGGSSVEQDKDGNNTKCELMELTIIKKKIVDD